MSEPKSIDATARPIVAVNDVHKSFGDLEVLKGVSMDVPKGAVVCIIGPSGSGKSTLLRCINGLIPINSGSIRVGEFDVHGLKTASDRIALRKEVSIVFQQFNLFPHKTALENVMMAPIHVLREPKDEVRLRALALLKKVGLSAKRDTYPGDLSGGQQQRVAIARALVTEPALLLADEPTGNLDSTSGADVMAILRELNAAGRTIVLITHDQDVAEAAGRQIHLRDGRVLA
jgi:polar amino acid transport system ATP-binding protein